MSKGLRIAMAISLGIVLCFAALLAGLMATPQGRSFFEGAGRLGEVAADPRKQAEIAQDIEKNCRLVAADGAMNRARSYYNSRRYEKALDVAVVAGLSYRGIYGKEYGGSIPIRHYEALRLQAQCESNLRRIDKSLQTYRDALDLAGEIKRAKPDSHSSYDRIVESYRSLADALANNKKPAAAEENYRLALLMGEEADTKFGRSFANDCTLANNRSVYGTFLVGLERYTDAEAALQNGLKELHDLETSERGRGDGKEWLGRTIGTNLEMTGRLREKQKRFAAAAECYEKSLESFEAVDLINSNVSQAMVTAGESAEAMGDLISTGSGDANDVLGTAKQQHASVDAAKRQRMASAFRYYRTALRYYERAKELGSRGLDERIRSIKATLESLE